MIYFSAPDEVRRLTTPDADKEAGLDLKTIVYYTLVAIPVAFTIFGLGYMCRTNCDIRKKCCECCIDLEKEDKNLDYGAYYYDDGERRQDVVEVNLNYFLSQLKKIENATGGR